MFSYLQSLLVLYSLEILWNRDIGLETLFSAILVYICSFVKELFAGRGQAPFGVNLTAFCFLRRVQGGG